MDRQAQRDIRRKLNCLRFAQERGSNVLACRKFGVSKSSFYRWKASYKEKGEAGLINSKPCPENPAWRTPWKMDEKLIDDSLRDNPNASIHEIAEMVSKKI